MTATLCASCGASGFASHTVVPVSMVTSSAVLYWRKHSGAITAAKRGDPISRSVDVRRVRQELPTSWSFATPVAPHRRYRRHLHRANPVRPRLNPALTSSRPGPPHTHDLPNEG